MAEASVGSQPLPAWSDDPLDRLLADAEYNVRASALNCPRVYAYLQRVHGAFLRMADTIEKDSPTQLLIPRLLAIRSHGAVLAALRLGMAGQLYETAPLVRVAIEQAWYALHIARDPKPPDRWTLWIHRNDDEEATRACKDEFLVGKVRATHELLDPETAAHMHRVYERSIDFGAHPNQMGLLAWLERSEEAGRTTTYHVGLLRADVLPVVATLRLVVDAALGVLKTLELIFAKRFEIMGLDQQIGSLAEEAPGVFHSYAQS